MRYVDEFRDPGRVRRAAEALAASLTRPWTVMEVCGGQTHAFARFSLEELLPPGLTLVHGPGCPVCVTPLEVLETARQVALQPGVILASFGDMLRVPGLRGDLLQARGEGADVRVVLSPLDAVKLAEDNPGRFVAFFGVGFETTAPATAMAVTLAAALDLQNFGVVAAHVRVPPAMEHLLSDPRNRIDGFLAAGHVCTIAGTREYPAIAERFRVPIVVAGFEPLDLLDGLIRVVRRLEAGLGGVENAYARSVREEGNPAAQDVVDRVYEVADQAWRGMGVIPRGGLRLRHELRRFDAASRLGVRVESAPEPAACLAAEVLQGRLNPRECPAFGGACTPEHPLGAPMVSSEGACAAWYRYRRTARAGAHP